MWSSIEQIIQPESLNEASQLLEQKGAILFAGGSYLVSQKDRSIHTLIDINHLISDKIEYRGEIQHIEAGCTLEEMRQSGNETLNNAIQACCPSKSIRNQRTIGGEIAEARPDSDLLVLLYAAGTSLILNHTESPIRLIDWDGSGIIVKVIIPKNAVRMERVALLDSAPAFVIVGVNMIGGSNTVCVGGKLSTMAYSQTSNSLEGDSFKSFLDNLETSFSDDHLGSPFYKRELVSNLLQEMGGAR